MPRLGDRIDAIARSSELGRAALLLPTALWLALFVQGGIAICCDAEAYLAAIEGHQREGLFHRHPLVGYRSFLFPYFFSWFPLDHTAPVFGEVRGYSLAACGLFLLAEFGVLRGLRQSRLFWPTYLGFFANPLLLVYVPYPLQESFLVLAFVALTPWLLDPERFKAGWQLPGVAGLFLGILYMTRPSNIVLAIPVAWLLLAHLRHLPSAAARARASGLFIALAAIVVLPQSAISLRYHDSPLPYSATRALSFQLSAGEAYAKYSTDLFSRAGAGRPMPSWNPLNCDSATKGQKRKRRTFECARDAPNRREGPGAYAFTALIHVFNALNYDVLKPYVTNRSVPLFSLSQILSMGVAFLGGFAAFRKLTLRTASGQDVFLLLVAGVTLAVTTITAAETRFGLLATAAFSWFAAELVLQGRLERREWVAVGFGLSVFTVVSALLSVYVLTLSGAASP